MELKFTKNAVVIQVDEFELNLYGIEIVLYCSVVLLCWRFELNLYGIEMLIILTALSCSEGLNWTFMELKFFSMVLSIETSVFELNLYGIEIPFSLMKKQLMIVWIEPLWNWNTQPRADSLFVSLCLNWTFMELKYFHTSKSIDALYSFELNLYGIEIL